MLQVLWIEMVLKAASGAALITFPGLVAAALGLPPVTHAFWARIAGALLLGIGAAAYVQGAWPKIGGIGTGGLIAVNLAGAAVLASLVILKRGAETRRGTIALIAMLSVLLLLALVEIAFLNTSR